MAEKPTKSSLMHSNLKLTIGRELPHSSLQFHEFLSASRPYLCERDVSENRTYAEDILTALEARGHMSIGDYDRLKLILYSADLGALHRIVCTEEAAIKNQLKLENTATVTGNSSKPENLTIIQKHCRKRYKRHLRSLRPFPFCGFRDIDLDHVFTNLEIIPGTKHRVSVRAEVEQQCDSIEKLTETLWNTRDRTVCLIEGSPGVGKTTLCRRLAYLWSEGENQIHNHPFDIVCLLEARSLTENLAQSVFKQMFPRTFQLNQNTIYDILNNGQQRCLLIIDGLDEIPETCKDMVKTLLQGEDSLSDINIILTGRPESSSEYIRYVDKHLRITGYTLKNTESYMYKYFSKKQDDSRDMLLNRIREDGDLAKLAENPFMTLLLCVLAENKADIPSDSGGIMMQIIKTIYKVYTSKTVQFLPNEMETFQDKLFWAGSELAYFGVKNDMVLEFTNKQVYSLLGEELGGHLLKSGIVSRDYSLSGIDLRDFCYFPHKSLQEFLCAWHLAQLSTECFAAKAKDLPVESNAYAETWERLIPMVIDKPSMAKVLIQHLLRPIVGLPGNNRFIHSVCRLFDKVLELVKHPDLFDLIAREAIKKHTVFIHVCCIPIDNRMEIKLRILAEMVLVPCLFISRGIYMPDITMGDEGELLYYLFSSLDDGALDCEEELFKRLYLKPLIWKFSCPISINLMHLPRREEDILHHSSLAGLILQWVVCADIGTIIKLLNKDLTVHVFSLLLITYQFNFQRFLNLLKSLESVKRDTRIIVTIYSSSCDDYLYMRMCSLLRSVKNENIHIFISLQPFKPTCEDELLHPYNGILALPVPQMFYERYSPY